MNWRDTVLTQQELYDLVDELQSKLDVAKHMCDCTAERLKELEAENERLRAELASLRPEREECDSSYHSDSG